MKRFLFSSLVLIIGITAAFGLQIVSAQTFPTTNPPSGNIIPHFSAVLVDGDTTVGGFLKVGNNIKPKSGISLGLDGHVNITKGLDVTPNLYESAIVAKGNLDVQGTIKNSAGDAVVFAQPLESNGGTLDLNGNVRVHGTIKNDDDTSLWLDDVDGVTFAGNTFKAKEGGSSISGDMALDQSRIKAQSFGDIRRVMSIFQTLPSSPKSTSKSVTCPKSSIVLSCYGNVDQAFDTSKNSWLKDAAFFDTEVLDSGSSSSTPTCTISASANKDLIKPAALAFRAVAVCFDPNKFDVGNDK